MSETIKFSICPKCQSPIPAEAPQGLCPKCVLGGAASPTEAGGSATATGEIPTIARIAAAFPQLEIMELIGRGGMGFVFKARQPHLDRYVALKLLPDKLASDPQFAERFNREGRVLARLNHPNIVSIFDFGQAGGFYFLLMEYVDGVNLRQAMQAGRFSPAEALTIVPKICEALQFAHEEGILHRDIKPENILIDAKGRVKIADFGIAKLVGEKHPDVSLTATGAALGTMHYMAPEQIEKPSTVDHRADIYSLGVVFYELLTGELPLGRFGPPSAKTPVDTRVDEVVMRTLEKEREKRFQSAGEMGTTVEHLTEVGAGATASRLPPADDFILCPPRLPRMAKAIIIYALVLAPVFWLLGLFTIESLPEHALVKFVQGALNVLISGGEFLVLLVLAIGGWKLRALRSSAPGWLKTALWLHLALTVVAIAGQIWVEVLTDQLIPNAPAKHLGLGEGVIVAVILATVIFEISALVWLRRHGAMLKAFLKSGGAPKRPRGTMVIPPSAAVSSVPAWSKKAIWSAALVAVSLVGPLVLAAIVSFIFARARLGGWEMLAVALLPAMAGTILGWMALSDIRAHRGQLRGLPLAVFAALAWPLVLLVSITLVVPAILAYQAVGGVRPSMLLAILVPAGTITFAIWAVYATARWGGNKPATQRRGVLKWIFLAIILFGASAIVVSHLPPVRQVHHVSSPPPTLPTSTYTTPWIRFTITAVELRELAGVRWLAIDYLDDVHGECQKSFPWEATIPGFKAATRTSEFRTDAKNSSPAVRHQRVEYRLPDSVSRPEAEVFADNVRVELIQKSFRLELGEEKLLFDLHPESGGSLQARIKVMPPLKDLSEQSPAFGPVIESVLPELTAIDLESRQTKVLPTSLANRKSGAEKDVGISDWLEREGADLVFVGRGVFYGSMQDVVTKGQDAWSTFSPAQLAASLHPIGKAVPFKLENKKQAAFTYGFKTRDGRLGFLQITDYPDNAGSAKIRYKLVPPLKSASPQRNQLGVVRLVGARDYQNLALMRIESLPNHPLHDIVVRFSGPELPEKVALAPKPTSGPYVMPSPDEDMKSPVTEPVANGDPVGTNQAPSASAIRVDCPGDYSFSFVLPDESQARDADRQIKMALAQPVSLATGQQLLLFTIGERKAWLELRPFHPAPNKLTFFRHGGRSPASAASSNHIECAVATVPPGCELELVGRLMLTGQNRAEPAFGATLTSGPDEPGVYWLTWYSLPNPQTMDTGEKDDWELLVHDVMGHELLRVRAPEELKQGWSRRWIGESRSAQAGEPIHQILFQKVEKTRAGDRRPSYVNLEMTMRRPGTPDR